MKLLKNYLIKRDVFQISNLDDKTIFFIFKKVIKEEFGNTGVNYLHPELYKNKTIFIKSDNSLWLSELWLNRERIIRKINSEIGGSVVEKIKV